MSGVFALGYLGIAATDIAAWEQFATEVLDMHVEHHEDGLRLRMDEREWRMAVEPADWDGLAYVGWEVASSRTLDDLAVLLADAGHEVRNAPKLAARRGVRRLLQVEDPDGMPLELFVGARGTPIPRRGRTDFVTGGLGLGHVVFTVQDVEATKSFYLDVLGFRISDVVGASHFTRVNPRHHSLAFRQSDDGSSTFRHLMVEVASLDMVGRALDRASAYDGVLACGLGRHTNDHAVSFYVKTPSGFEIEYGALARCVDESTWSEGSYTTTSIWGHERYQPV